MKSFLSENRKYINGWAITRDNSEFGDKGDVVFIYNDENGKRMRRVIPTGKSNWYFYVRKSERSLEVLKEIYNVPSRLKIGNEWIRIYFPRLEYQGAEIKDLVSKLEENGIETYEADLGPTKRLCLDWDLKIEDWEKIRVLYFDIETDDSAGGIVIGRDRILSLSGIDQNGTEYFLSDPDEKKLLLLIKNLLSQFDMLIGWNSKDFDLPYLKERYRKNGIKFEYLFNVLHEDMMKRIQYFYSKDPEARQSISSYSLDYISGYFLNEHKIKRSGKIIDLYNNDFENFKEYNIQDSRLLKKLEDKLGTIKLTYMMFQWCGLFAQDWSMVKAVDNFILSDANKKGIHYRTNLNQFLGNSDEEGEEFLGAYVIDPIPGFYENVYDLDFKSLYPNIIRTFNISPETSTVLPGEKYYQTPSIKDDKGDHGGIKYSAERQGVISEKISKLLDQREEIRKELKGFQKDSQEWKNLNVKQLIVKELANSIYGVLGNKWFRSFDIQLAESITATGQYLIKYVKKINEESDRKVIYGDTDSIFLIIKDGENIEEVLKEINLNLAEHLKKEFKIKKNTIEMALDVKFDKFVIETKKKYVGKIGKTYKFVGMECIKRDTIPIAVNYQKKLIDKIMEKETEDGIMKWIEEKKKAIETEDFKLEDISIRKKLSKDPKEYKAKTSGRTYTAPIHVRIASDLISRKKTSGEKSELISPGSIIQYVITNGGKGTKAEGIHISEFTGEWDRKYYWENIVYPPMERLLVAVFGRGFTGPK